MDPLEFLEVAKGFSASSLERERRTSVGRSYYAVFNHLRLRLEVLKPLPMNADVHALVVKYLSNAPNRELNSVGQTLRDLRAARNTADYDLAAMVDDKQSSTSMLKADRAIKKSQGISEAALRAAINVLPTYH